MSADLNSLASIFGISDVMQQFQTFGVLISTMNAICIWEVATHLPQEIKFIFWPDLKELFIRKKLPPLPSVLLFNARLLVIPVAGLSFQMVVPSGGLGPPSNFKIIFKTYVFIFCATVANGLAVFVTRCTAIRDSKRPMKIFLWCCYAIVCIFHLCCSALVEIPDGFLLAAGNRPPLQTYLPWIFFVSANVAFDLLILILSLAPQFEGYEWKPTYSVVARRFYFDAITYFTISLAVSIFDCAWIIAHRYDGLMVTFAIPIHIWLAVVISPRIIRNLKLHSAKQQAGVNRELSIKRSPFTSVGQGLVDALPIASHRASSQPQYIYPDTLVITKEKSYYVSSLHSNTSTSHIKV